MTLARDAGTLEGTGDGATTELVLVADTLSVLGGVQRVVADLAGGLAARGRRVHRIEIDGPGGDPAVTTLVPGGERRLPYEPVTWWQRIKLAARGPWAWHALAERDRAARTLGSMLAGSPGAVVVLTQLRSAEHAVAGLRGVPPERRPRLVLQYHDAFHAAQVNGDLARICRLVPLVDEFLALSDGDARLFGDALGSPVGVQRNPVDVAGIVDATGAVDRPREDVVVVGARYDNQKALDVLVRAWARVAPERPTWRLELWGDGPLRGDLERQVADLGLTGSVDVAGATDDFVGRLRAASLSALSSRHEGMGLVLAEASAAGVPCVTTDAGPGVRDVVEDGVTGAVVPVGDDVALAAALVGLMDDGERRARFAAAARERAERFARDRVLDQWEARLDAGSSVAGGPRG